jgi:hypothetical protein
MVLTGPTNCLFVCVKRPHQGRRPGPIYPVGCWASTRSQLFATATGRSPPIEGSPDDLLQNRSLSRPDDTGRTTTECGY